MGQNRPNINGYRFEKPLSDGISGFSVWGIGEKEGRKYFVKQFLSPKFPVDEHGNDLLTKTAQVAECRTFEKKKKSFYETLHNAAAADGNLVEVHQFFRDHAMYYIVTEAIQQKTLHMDEIAKLTMEKKLQLCCSIARSFAVLHQYKLVHADVKADNLMITNPEHPRAQVIDFDAGFLEREAPQLGEELNGDLAYLSPEAFRHMAEMESNLTCKMDIFSLGILFHEYLTGEKPGFDHSSYSAVYEAVLDGAELSMHPSLHDNLQKLILSMLHDDPALRPDASDIFDLLRQELALEKKKA